MRHKWAITLPPFYPGTSKEDPGLGIIIVEVLPPPIG